MTKRFTEFLERTDIRENFSKSFRTSQSAIPAAICMWPGNKQCQVEIKRIRVNTGFKSFYHHSEDRYPNMKFKVGNIE